MDAILTLNAGSSSIKFALFPIGPAASAPAILRGEVEEKGDDVHFFWANSTGQREVDESWGLASFEERLRRLMERLEDRIGRDRLLAAGHRVVHGGPDHSVTERVDGRLLAALDQLSPLAPIHVPHNLQPIRMLQVLRPHLPQFVCFDTAFHHTIPRLKSLFPLPAHYAAEGIRRYGFHGLSYEYLAGRLAELSPRLSSGKVVLAHLGSGASLCALVAGKSHDTTMGFTALDGLMMGSRAGAFDPGALLHIMRRDGLALSEAEDMLYRKSGLLGVSGISADMRVLLQSAEPSAREAIDLFCLRVVKETAALAASMGGIDGLVFSAGIGEHAAPIRAEVMEGLAFLGLEFDPDANDRHADVISTAGSRIEVRVIATDEEAMIARSVRQMLVIQG